METSYSKYQLWSPPLLDLSLDSFSNDLIQEFDKTRTNISNNNNKDNDNSSSSEAQKNEVAVAVIKQADSTEEGQQEQQQESLDVTNKVHQDSILSSSLISSSVTLPPSEREVSFHEEDSSSTANLFRKSSTFLKKKLSQSGGSHNKKEENNNSSIPTSNAEEISTIISHQYPPKPLHYSPVVEPPSDNLQPSVNNNSDNEATIPVAVPYANVDVPRNMREVTVTASTGKSNYTSKTMSDPISSTVGTSTTATPKRRSFFSLRFC